MTREEALERIIAAGGPPTEALERREFEAWLERDPELRSISAQQQELWRTMETWEPVELSLDFNRRLYERIDAQEARRNPFLGWFASLRPSFAIGLAVLVVAAASIVVERPAPRPVAVKAQLAPIADERLREEIDRVLDDLEMLADFEVFPLAEDPVGRS